MTDKGALGQVLEGEALFPVLELLSKDPHYENIIKLIKDVLQAEDKLHWLVSELLFYAKFLLDWHMIEEWKWDGHSSWPQEISEFLWGRYRLRLSKGKKEALLCWTATKFLDVILLSRPGHIRLFEAKGDIGELAFRSYLDKINEKMEFDPLSARTLDIYYQAIMTFPQQRPEGWLQRRLEEVIYREFVAHRKEHGKNLGGSYTSASRKAAKRAGY